MSEPYLAIVVQYEKKEYIFFNYEIFTTKLFFLINIYAQLYVFIQNIIFQKHIVLAKEDNSKIIEKQGDFFQYFYEHFKSVFKDNAYCLYKVTGR